MKIVQSTLSVTLLCLSVGCVSRGTAPATLSPGASQPLGREITTLRDRNGFVEIRTGPEGRSFNVLDAAGRALAVNLSEAELRSQFPNQSEALRTGLAGPVAASWLVARSQLLAEAWEQSYFADR